MTAGSAAAAVLVVEEPGLLTTIQDRGRWGHQAEAVPVAGPMDWWSFERANRVVGNPPGAAALEITVIGPTLRCTADIVVGIAGAAFDVRIDGVPVPAGGAHSLRSGARVSFGTRLRGARAYVAVRGGIDSPKTLGSRSTHLASRMGGLSGCALRAGDVLAAGHLEVGEAFGSSRDAAAFDPVTGGPQLRVLPGPHVREWPGILEWLTSAPFAVTPAADRMGYRLRGPGGPPTGAPDILSFGVPMGTVQVPPAGQPILLMADRQTTGGYPVPAVVIAADLPIAGQLAPGDPVQFRLCDESEASAALAERIAALGGLRAS